MILKIVRCSVLIKVKRMQGREHEDFKWVPARGGEIPENAIVGGMEDTGAPLFVARHLHMESMVVGKAAPQIKGMTFGYDCREHHTSEYEVLVGDARKVHWIPCFGQLKSCEKTPLKAGYEADGLELFACKTRLSMGEVIGKVSTDMSKGMIYSYTGKECSVKNFDIYYILCVE
ncbi:hypothetical protein DSO57_1015888 [Entomophthora muscae]|uniref:Uncharacterized protein n=1 Tax=Entomophthora muscae TaxID=34485 RepID=A0ACC2S726_9FUNG|nr:hypothetical protein DSO57_1015888 [Entomophthora muscae]